MITPTTYIKEIDQQHTDFTSRLSISTLISLILGTAGQDANNKGFGIEHLGEVNCTWVLSRFAIEILRLPRAFEKISIRTWISDVNRIISTRNFLVEDEGGEKIAEVVSQWSVIDLAERKAVDLTKLFTSRSEYILGALDASTSRPKKIPALGNATIQTHIARYSDVDFNCHVNANRYFELMIDALPLEKLKHEKPLRVDLQYIQECYYGDELTISYEERETASLFEITRNSTNSAAVKCMITW